jgi:dolichol-phosphate mannosyltransferase
VAALGRLRLTEDGYALPMQFWVQAAAKGLRIREVGVKLIYNDPNRSFGGPLDDPAVRIAHYRRVLHCELERCARRLPREALLDVDAGCGCEG